MTGPFPDDSLPPDQGDDALAGEYVLGVLALPDWMAVERRIASDPGFAARVRAWEHRLSGLNDGFVPEAPPPGLLNRVEERLFARPAPARRFWQGWRGWLGGAATAAALGLALWLALPDRDPVILAELGSRESGLQYEVRHDGTRLSVTRLAGSGPGTGQDHELWIIAPDAAPVSLGLLGDRPLSVEYPAPPAGWVLAVSVEPAGGSPTGAPTGPVILTAEIGA